MYATRSSPTPASQVTFDISSCCCPSNFLPQFLSKPIASETWICLIDHPLYSSWGPLSTEQHFFLAFFIIDISCPGKKTYFRPPYPTSCCFASYTTTLEPWQPITSSEVSASAASDTSWRHVGDRSDRAQSWFKTIGVLNTSFSFRESFSGFISKKKWNMKKYICFLQKVTWQTFEKADIKHHRGASRIPGCGNPWGLACKKPLHKITPTTVPEEV